MAKIAVDRGEHPELKALAANIVAAQESEIAQMREWRKDWFGSAQTPPIDAMPLLPGMQMEDHSMGEMEMGGTMDMTTDIETLRTAQPFDKAFLEAMIPHHESAITAAQLAQQSATKAEIKELAAAIIGAQQSGDRADARVARRLVLARRNHMLRYRSAKELSDGREPSYTRDAKKPHRPSFGVSRRSSPR